MRAVRRGSRRRRRPVFAWLIIIAVITAAAVLAGRAFRGPVHVRTPTSRPVLTAVQVYFVRGGSRGRPLSLAAVHRRVGHAAEEALTASALRALLDGPSRAERSRGLVTEIPSGTVLRGFKITGDQATVDLGVSFAQGGGSSTMLARVWQVVYTATQFPHVASVQLLIGGRRVDTLGGEGLMIGAPLRRPARMPTF